METVFRRPTPYTKGWRERLIMSLGIRSGFYGLRVAGYELRVAGYGLRVTCYALRVTCYGFHGHPSSVIGQP